MTRRSGRGYFNKIDVLEKLKTGRDGAVLVCSKTAPGTPEYKKAAYVLEAVDDLAGELTGDRELFWTGAATTPPRE